MMTDASGVRTIPAKAAPMQEDDTAEELTGRLDDIRRMTGDLDF